MQNDVKPGYMTTEFWLTGLSGIAGAVIAIFISYGVLSSDEGQMWMGLIVAVLPLALAAYSIGKYSESRGKVKAEAAWVGQEPIQVIAGIPAEK